MFSIFIQVRTANVRVLAGGLFHTGNVCLITATIKEARRRTVTSQHSKLLYRKQCSVQSESCKQPCYVTYFFFCCLCNYSFLKVSDNHYLTLLEMIHRLHYISYSTSSETNNAQKILQERRWGGLYMSHVARNEVWYTLLIYKNVYFWLQLWILTCTKCKRNVRLF